MAQPSLSTLDVSPQFPDRPADVGVIALHPDTEDDLLILAEGQPRRKSLDRYLRTRLSQLDFAGGAKSRRVTRFRTILKMRNLLNTERAAF